MKPKLTRQEALQKAQTALNGAELEFPFVLVIRGYYKQTMGDPTKNDVGIYDDAIFILGRDTFAGYQANCDPSTWLTKKAQIAPGLWRFTAGIHKLNNPLGYPAFRQFGNVTVNRVNGKPETGYFGINIHKGGVLKTGSEGCITLPPVYWDEFKTILYRELHVTDAEVKKKPTGNQAWSFRVLVINNV